MGAARKIWEDAKARIKDPQDWEAQLHLKDAYGSSLDAVEKLIADASPKVKSVETDMRKLESLGAAIIATGKKYRQNLRANAASGRHNASTGLSPNDIKILAGGLDDAAKTALSRLREAWSPTADFPARSIEDLLSD